MSGCPYEKLDCQIKQNKNMENETRKLDEDGNLHKPLVRRSAFYKLADEFRQWNRRRELFEKQEIIKKPPPSDEFITEMEKKEASNVLYTLFATVISKLPHSEGRVPYTYHHDYLRMNVDKFKGCSRSEVASKHTENKDELYAVALTQLIDELDFRDTMYLSSDDINVCWKAIGITESVVSRYSK